MNATTTMKQKNSQAMPADDASGRAIEGAAGARVSAAQVRRLILTAQRAWREQCRLGLTDEPFEGWRHGALYDAVRRVSFRAVGQREWGVAMGHFEQLAGEDTRAGWFNAGVARREASGDGDRGRAEWKLRQECAEHDEVFGGEGAALDYAMALLRQIHRTSLTDATAKQIWQTLFTLRNRAAKHGKKAGGM